MCSAIRRISALRLERLSRASGVVLGVTIFDAARSNHGLLSSVLVEEAKNRDGFM